MPIFKIKGNLVEKIKPTTLVGYEKEKKLQTLIENNLESIFEMTFIDSEFSTTHGGRIDSLAIDKTNRPVIIEYKFDRSSTVLLQGLYYMDWLVDNQAEFEKLVKKKLKKEVPINWKGGIRLILIAKTFEVWDKFAVNRIIEEVELYEYTFYESNELKLDKVTLPKDFKSKPKTSITKITGFTVEDQLKKIHSKRIKALVNELREEIKLISDNIEERATYYHISYKSSLNFAAIYTQKNNFWFNVRLPKRAVIKKFKRLDVRDHKDEVYTHIRYNDKTNIDDFVTLAKMAFENTK